MGGGKKWSFFLFYFTLLLFNAEPVLHACVHFPIWEFVRLAWASLFLSPSLPLCLLFPHTHPLYVQSGCRVLSIWMQMGEPVWLLSRSLFQSNRTRKWNTREEIMPNEWWVQARWWFHAGSRGLCEGMEHSGSCLFVMKQLSTRWHCGVVSACSWLCWLCFVCSACSQGTTAADANPFFFFPFFFHALQCVYSNAHKERSPDTTQIAQLSQSVWCLPASFPISGELEGDRRVHANRNAEQESGLESRDSQTQADTLPKRRGYRHTLMNIHAQEKRHMRCTCMRPCAPAGTPSSGALISSGSLMRWAIPIPSQGATLHNSF